MLEVIEIASRAGAPVNEDRAGAAGSLAWVIDGATDVVDTPLTPGATDASWAAETLDQALRALANEPNVDLSVLPAYLSNGLRAEFARVARRQPESRAEHPSASGLIVQCTGRRAEYLAIGDCTLLADVGDAVERHGTEESDAGDPWVASAIANFHATSSRASALEARAHVWPRIRAARNLMNEPNGYGVLSITSTPTHFIKAGYVDVPAGGHLLLATDGLMRIVDIFRRLASAELLAACRSRGLSNVLTQVRNLEDEDARCVAHPRAKQHDDASGVLIRID